MGTSEEIESGRGKERTERQARGFGTSLREAGKGKDRKTGNGVWDQLERGKERKGQKNREWGFGPA